MIAVCAADRQAARPPNMKRPEQPEVQALLDRHSIIPAPECPPELLAAHRNLIYFIVRAFESDARAAVGLLTAVVEWYRRYDELADGSLDLVGEVGVDERARRRRASGPTHPA